MKILENGVLLGAEEVIGFFQEACEERGVIVYCQGNYVIGDITAITKDNRFVIDVDMPIVTGCELYSAQFKDVTVTRTENQIEIRII